MKNANYMLEIDWQFCARFLDKIQAETIGKKLASHASPHYIPLHQSIICTSGQIINFIMFDSDEFYTLKHKHVKLQL